MAKVYTIWATDCDGPGDIRYAPTFDSKEEAQKWIDEFTKDLDGGDISEIWIEEEDGEEHCEDCNFTWDPSYMHHMCPPIEEEDD